MKGLADLKRTIKLGDKVQLLIVVNIVVFVVLYGLSVVATSAYHSVFPYLAFVADGMSSLGRFWTFISYSFVHANIWHLLLNMIMLFFVSNLFFTFFTTRQFLFVYFAGALGGSILYYISAFFFSMGAGLVGASAAVMAPLIAIAAFAPKMEVRLALLGRVKMIYIAAVIIVIDLFQLSSSNVGGHLAHLGGALVGFGYIFLLKRGIDLAKPKKRTAKNKSTFKKIYVNKSVDKNVTKETTTQKEIDAILDKISRSGYESLSKEEKEFLFRQGNR
ncbi:rhomboid family intramembrane serine protease [Myroides fluvii]|uniref:rhomboid family intramembrane serine protease n=1 Tax=Myroides fluvii TaxID=2572594 RepID=UPI00131D8186|nr:rhomboid family intramembrane serine protease [Myroides fluvii]